MANRSKKSAAPKSEKRSSRSTRKSTGSRSRKSSIKNVLGGKIKWGEAALFGLLGYEMGNVLQGSGLPEYLYSKYPMFAEAVNNSDAKDSGDFINKILGVGTGGKVLYDGLVEGKVTNNDLSILLPYTIGTVFDSNKSKSSSNQGRW